MTDVLVVDDDLKKFDRVSEVLLGALEGRVSVDHCTNAFDAAARLASKHFDLLVVDLHLPIRRDAAPEADGGMRLLDNMLMTPAIRRPTHVFGLTAYEDLHAAKAATFSQHGWQLARYSPSIDDWARVLGNLLLHIAEATNAAATNGHDFDLAIVTALDSPELSEVLALDAAWRQDRPVGDDTVYHVGKFTRGAVSLSVVACSAGDMGMPVAAALAMKLIHRFRPRYLAMCGIAAGIKGNFGDILFADQAWDYGSGKSRWRPRFGITRPKVLSRGLAQVSFEPAPVALPLDPFIKARLGLFQLSIGEVLYRIRARWQRDPQPAWPLVLTRGPVASGAAVLENAPLVESIKSHNRKVVGIEMETYGIFTAASLAPAPRPRAFSVKSICDFGDHRKDDRWQCYAAFTSAQLVYEFSLDQLTSATLVHVSPPPS